MLDLGGSQTNKKISMENPVEGEQMAKMGPDRTLTKKKKELNLAWPSVVSLRRLAVLPSRGKILLARVAPHDGGDVSSS